MQKFLYKTIVPIIALFAWVSLSSFTPRASKLKQQMIEIVAFTRKCDVYLAIRNYEEAVCIWEASCNQVIHLKNDIVRAENNNYYPANLAKELKMLFQVNGCLEDCFARSHKIPKNLRDRIDAANDKIEQEFRGINLGSTALGQIRKQAYQELEPEIRAIFWE